MATTLATLEVLVRQLQEIASASVAGTDPRLPTLNEKAALAGTSGAPGSGNKYVTDADARNTNARAPTAHTHPESDVTGLVSDLAAKAPLASPTFTGTPAAPTAAQGTNTTQLATTQYVQTEAGLLIPKSLIDAKGDTLIGSADNVAARLAVGSDGQVLTADSAQTLGVKWATPSAGGGGGTYVTSLPGSPTDGQEIFYAADATNGVIWHFRYRTAVAKWEFLGGPALLAGLWPGNVTPDSITSATYAALPTNPLSITVPLAGDYEVSLSATMDVPTAGVLVYLAFKRGASAASDADAINVRSDQLASVSANFQMLGIAASTAIALHAKTSTTGARVFNRALMIRPRRVS